MIIQSPWAAIDEQLLNAAAQVLPLSGDTVTLWADNEYLRFALYGDVWCVVAEGGGTRYFGGCFVGSCMSAERVKPILKRLIDVHGSRQLELFA